MEKTRLIDGLANYGADVNGINARFYGDYELYEKCLRQFFAEKNHATLDDCMKKSDFEGAFAAAHALKGLAGNMGLQPYYTVVYRLVEALRSSNYGVAGMEYEALLGQLATLRQKFPEIAAER